ncbi:MAG TPA: hypothetical protein VL096_08195 [Pirellulaceae bacterium]|nr:hypothetical protein [Pirellulaceae bacterium]
MGLTPDDDPFKPPSKPRKVACLHCGQHYSSDLIEWQILSGADGALNGFWCCPTIDCDGKGYEFDIYPVGKDGLSWFEREEADEDPDEDDEATDE